MSYSEMTDFEINCAVAASLGKEFFYSSPGEPGKRTKSFVIDDVCRDVYESGAWSSDVFDPCNSWADAGPIIQSHKISLHPDDTEKFWISSGLPKNGFSVTENHENPLRAAMIVFLMMQEA